MDHGLAEFKQEWERTHKNKVGYIEALNKFIGEREINLNRLNPNNAGRKTLKAKVQELQRHLAEVKRPVQAPRNPLNGPPGSDPNVPVVVKPTLTNGDCFFSSVFRAASEQGLLQRINESLPSIDISNEENFIRTFRYLLADNVDKSLDHLIGVLRGLYLAKNANSTNTLRDTMTRVDTFDAWHKALINKYLLVPKPNFDRFKVEFKAGLVKKGSYVCDIEIYTLRGLLELAGIAIRSSNVKFKTLPRHLVNDGVEQDIIHVYNPIGLHYEFFSFNPPGAGPGPGPGAGAGAGAGAGPGAGPGANSSNNSALALLIKKGATVTQAKFALHISSGNVFDAISFLRDQGLVSGGKRTRRKAKKRLR